MHTAVEVMGKNTNKAVHQNRLAIGAATPRKHDRRGDWELVGGRMFTRFL